jgi:hypothetical protein
VLLRQTALLTAAAGSLLAVIVPAVTEQSKQYSDSSSDSSSGKSVSVVAVSAQYKSCSHVSRAVSSVCVMCAYSCCSKEAELQKPAANYKNTVMIECL